MKTITSLALLVCVVFNSFAQGNNFFYTVDNEKVYLDTLDNKYMAYFPGGLYVDSIYPGDFLSMKYYGVTPEDTTDIDTFGANPMLLPLFTLSGDTTGAEVGIRLEIALQFIDSISLSQKNDIISTYGLTLLDSSASVMIYSVDDSVLEKAQAIYETELVEYCQPGIGGLIENAATYPTDPYFNKQYYLNNSGQTINDGNSGTAGADIKAPFAWDITKGSSDITVAVLDGGVQPDHPDIPASRQVIVNGSNFSVTPWGGPPAVSPSDANKPYPDYTDLGGAHGTACAGIIAASHNNEGIAGICPECKIMPMRKVKGPQWPDSYWGLAVDLAVQSNADIINLSQYNSSSTLQNPIPALTTALHGAIAAGTHIIICAGNTANRAAGNKGFVSFPSNIDNEGIIAVGASNRYDQVANYSPSGNEIDIVAPSTHASNKKIAGEAQDVWTTDIGLPSTGHEGYNEWPYEDSDFNGVPARFEYLPNSGTNYKMYTGRFSGTSAAAPMVAGVAALMLSVNECLGNKQLKDILIHTTDRVGGYSYAPSFTHENITGIVKAYHSDEMGHGRVNAFRAVQAAQSTRSTTLDLYIKDAAHDLGDKYSTEMDKSPDIWMRSTQDGFTKQAHTTPNLYNGRTVYIYVKVRNKSCVDYEHSTDNAKLKLYYTQSATWSSWPTGWVNIASQVLNKDIPAGGEVIYEIPWTIPSGVNIPQNNTGNICLLAELDGMHLVGDDINTYHPGRLDVQVKSQNNIATRNFTLINTATPLFQLPIPSNGGTVVVGDYPLTEASVSPGKYVVIGNPMSSAQTYDLRFSRGCIPGDTLCTDITAEAEVKLVFDSTGFAILNNAGAFSQDGVDIFADNQVIISSPDVTFSDITFPAETQSSVYISFGFWSHGQSTNEVFEYKVEQYFHSEPDTPIGTQHYGFIKAARDEFYADAGTDKEIDNGNSVQLSAVDIGEDAYYYWYDEENNMIDTTDITSVSPTETTTYKLEVVATADGFKDYDEVTVVVHQYFITSLNPNPADDQVTVHYEASGASTASLMIVPVVGGQPTSYSISTTETSKVIDITGYAPGNYSVVLICDSNNEDAENLLIN